ncbi:MAG: prolyl-tRNA synthetase [Candidatus Moranbacteria bacterium RIFCSPHIGHO2_01_FULL_55_24]|nr:MAG: prolyl-tRNA synthetase [Candidatus Moranbacteria bacterium RIFCSPHIGHO2_01_FULL_55_24]
MRQSRLFTRTKKTAPKDEVSKNAELLIRAGFVHKEMAGVYDYLPLGLRTLNKIIGIIREEMNGLGAEELLMSSLQRPDVWKATDRWDSEKVDVWFKTTLQSGSELGLALTHEDPLTDLMRSFVSSYRDLPFSVYQFQTKFRNEMRAKSGIMRGREFIMKDLYSFARTEAELDAFYEEAALAYERIFARVGLGEETYKTFASGGIFSKYSHEFQTLCEAGEDIIYVDEEKRIAINEEVFTDEVLQELGLDKEKLVQKKAVEVGNIFKLGTRFSEPLSLTYKDEQGKDQMVIMGSYGIGPGRVMGAIVETHADDNGLVWPEAVAPFRVHLLSLGADEKATEIYEALEKAGIEVLYDDREASAGEKFADADLLGIPYRVVIGKRSQESGHAEVKKRTESAAQEVALESLVSYFQS